MRLALLLSVGIFVAAPQSALDGAVDQAKARLDRAQELNRAGDAGGAREQCGEGAAQLLAADGAIADARARKVLWELGNVATELGQLELALEVRSRIRDHLEQTVGPEEDELQFARQNVAFVLVEIGRSDEAREIFEQVLAIFEANLPNDHPRLARTRQYLGNTLLQTGDLARARTLFEQVLAAREKSLPEGDVDLLAARLNLAVTLMRSGDVVGAHAIFARVLAKYEEILEDDNPALQAARQNAAATARELGDLAQAEVLFGKVVAVYERSLPPDHPALLVARLNLAAVLERVGEDEESRRLLETVVEGLPPDHPYARAARLNLSNRRARDGDLEGARELEEELLALEEAVLPPDHPDLAGARLALALTLSDLGQREAAKDLLLAVVASTRGPFPPRLEITTLAQRELARILSAPEDVEARRAVLVDLCAMLRGGLDRSLALSRRERETSTAPIANAVQDLTTLVELHGEDGGLRREVFEIAEAMRMLATDGATVAAAEPDTAQLRAKALALRTEVNDLVARVAEEPDLTERIAAVVRERDQVEADILAALRARGAAPPRMTLEGLAGALREGWVAVAYRMYARAKPEPGRDESTGEERLLAWLVKPDASLERVELGSLAPIAAAVEDWRRAVGEPVGRGAAAPPAPASPESLRTAGAAMRALVIDPVLDRAGDVRRLCVCPDGPLHLVPLDALPIEDGIFGERCEVQVEVSFARLLGGRTPGSAPAEPTLLAIGGVAFDADAADAPRADAVAPLVARARGGATVFADLPGTRGEVEAVAAMFAERFAGDEVVLLGREASKRRLFDEAPRATYLHVATHGYFAEAGLAPRESDERIAEAGAMVTALAPLTLCGLALAGANQGIDALGRVPGIVTGEELAGLDLGRCRLAVLSACETGLGTLRAGLGVQSLQAALHAAGARTVITSLWRVGDEATRELMTELYRRIWAEGEPPARALREAKASLRARGAPLRDWAGWILTGEPE